jgi:tripartite-type tricarboxylate transporter receptor subunit TctC
MFLVRHRSLAAAAAALSLAAFPSLGWSQAYPSQMVRVIVPYPAGGTTDAIARAVVQRLVWSHPIVIENKAGAGTRIGAEAVAKADPDGHTLLITAEATFVVNPHVYSKLSYSITDFVPVAGLGISTHVLVAHPSVPARSVTELVALAKAKPGELNYGTFGPGSSAHLNMEMFQSAAGVRLKPVHYRGAAPMMTDLIGGHIQTAFVGITLAAEPLKAGQLKGLGVGSSRPLDQFLDLPPIGASGLPSFQAISWFGVFAPAKTPPHVVAKVSSDVQRITSSADFREKFLDANYLQPLPGTPEEFARYVEADAAKWGRIIRDGKITVE